MERQKILQVMEKNKSFFETRNADVAFGTYRGNIFYVIDEYGELDNICYFKTAEELERIIAATLIEDIETVMTVSVEAIGLRFSAEGIKECDTYVHEKMNTFVPEVAKMLRIIGDETAEWSRLFRQLIEVCKE